MAQLIQNTQLLEGVFTMTELLALADVDCLVTVGQKQDRGKTRFSPVAVLFWAELVTVEQFLHLLIGDSFLMDYIGNVAHLAEVFTKSQILYLPQ